MTKKEREMRKKELLRTTDTFPRNFLSTRTHTHTHTLYRNSVAWL